MLASLLSPDWTAGTTLAHLPIQPLLERPQGPIRALVLDVDCTLLPRRSATLPPSVCPSPPRRASRAAPPCGAWWRNWAWNPLRSPW